MKKIILPILILFIGSTGYSFSQNTTLVRCNQMQFENNDVDTKVSVSVVQNLISLENHIRITINDTDIELSTSIVDVEATEDGLVASNSGANLIAINPDIPQTHEAQPKESILFLTEFLSINAYRLTCNFNVYDLL